MTLDGLFADLDPDERAAALSQLRHDIARRRRRAEETPRLVRAEKFCPACETVKPVEDFGRNAARPDGLQSICRACR